MKRLILGAFILAAIAPATIPASATTYPDGDANCSGTVTMADVNLVMATYLQKPGLPAVPGWCGARVDMNCDGDITPADANIIMAIYFHWPVEYPESCD